MNWYKAKTILILFFLCTNIFLLVNILNAADKSTVIPDEVIASAVEIMARNGVSIDPGIIPRRNESVAVIHAENVIQEQADFAQKLLGGPVQKNADGAFTGPAGELRISGDTFSFTAGNNDSRSASASPAKTAEAFLKRLDFDLSGTKKTVDGPVVYYRKKFAGYPFLDGQITLETKNGAVISASGCWFQAKKQSLFSEKVVLKSITSVLVDYAADETPAAAVTGLEFGFALPQTGSYHKTVQLIPVWVILTDEGERIFMDARENNT